MTTSHQPGTLEPVKPALIVKIVMRPLTRILNPMIMKLAGRRHFRMAAQIRHTGRRSGRVYVTPVGARLHGGVIVIPLTFGNQSDWSRNVAAAGGCSITVNGRDYRATRPEFLSRDQAAELIKPMFSPVERASFRMLGIRQFIRLDALPTPPPSPATSGDLPDGHAHPDARRRGCRTHSVRTT